MIPAACLEITPDLGVTRQWEARLGLPAGGHDERMRDAWAGGSVGTLTEDEVQRSIGTAAAWMWSCSRRSRPTFWREYLGASNTELIEYAWRLRPRYRAGILSNSFVGAGEREQAA